MTKDLINRLTNAKRHSLSIGDCWNLMDEAADALERLTSGDVEPVLEVIRMPDHWVGGCFYDCGGSYISEGAISKLPIGTKLYAEAQLREAYAAGQRDMREAAERVCVNESCSCWWTQDAAEMASHLQDAIRALPIENLTTGETK